MLVNRATGPQVSIPDQKSLSEAQHSGVTAPAVAWMEDKHVEEPRRGWSRAIRTGLRRGPRGCGGPEPLSPGSLCSSSLSVRTAHRALLLQKREKT